MLGVCVCVTMCVYASGHKLNCDTYKVDDLGNKYIQIYVCRGQPQEKENSADHQREHSKLLGVCECASMHKRYVHLVYVYIYI